MQVRALPAIAYTVRAGYHCLQGYTRFAKRGIPEYSTCLFVQILGHGNRIAIRNPVNMVNISVLPPVGTSDEYK